MFSSQSETYVHAARASVWRVFTAVSTWPTWHPSIVSAKLNEPNSWQEGSVITVAGSAGGSLRTEMRGRIRMAVPHMSTVIEWQVMGVEFVDGFQFTDAVGGCRVRLRRTVHGPVALIFHAMPWLVNSRVRAWTECLRDAVEKNAGT